MIKPTTTSCRMPRHLTQPCATSAGSVWFAWDATPSCRGAVTCRSDPVLTCWRAAGSGGSRRSAPHAAGTRCDSVRAASRTDSHHTRSPRTDGGRAGLCTPSRRLDTASPSVTALRPSVTAHSPTLRPSTRALSDPRTQNVRPVRPAHSECLIRSDSLSTPRRASIRSPSRPEQHSTAAAAAAAAAAARRPPPSASRPYWGPHLLLVTQCRGRCALARKDRPCLWSDHGIDCC